MKRVLIPFIILILAFTACNNRRIVSETPIKTNILGVELCKTMNSKDVCDSLMLNTGEFFLSVPEKNGNIEGYRLVPWDQNFTYGGLSWTYIDVAVTNEKEVFIIYLYGSYESLKNAKQHYDSAAALFTQKYGKGNTPEEGNIFWTDNVNSIGLRYYESSATDGTDRSFCELYYCNIALSEKVYKENQPDI